MRIVPFPGPREEPWHDEIEAALRGEGEGAAAGAWRELREDVRALTPPMTAEFERRLGARIEGWTAGSPRSEAPRPADSSDAPRPAGPAPRRARRRRLPSLRLPSSRLRIAGAAGAACALVAAVLIVGSWPTGHLVSPIAQPAGPARVRAGDLESAPAAGGAQAREEEARRKGSLGTAGASSAAGEEAGQSGASGSGRVQQLAASLTLSCAPSAVQSIAGRVAQLTVSDGGFVQSSQVQTQREGASEANLELRVPSARLSAALAALGQLAPVRAENQSLQDITDAYDSARRELADAVAERGALLRALSRAVTQGQIDSLHEQLSLAGGAITRARAALHAVSARASTSVLEVTVLGDSPAGDAGSTLHRGLHDAGEVLTIALVVLLIGAAVLVPLAILLAVLILGGRAWRRYLRERALV
jgi:Domain of unknown function (DUF4349)